MGGEREIGVDEALGIGRRRGGSEPTVLGGRKATFYIAAANEIWVSKVEKDRRLRSASDAARTIFDEHERWAEVIAILESYPDELSPRWEAELAEAIARVKKEP